MKLSTGSQIQFILFYIIEQKNFNIKNIIFIDYIEANTQI